MSGARGPRPARHRRDTGRLPLSVLLCGLGCLIGAGVLLGLQPAPDVGALGAAPATSASAGPRLLLPAGPAPGGRVLSRPGGPVPPPPPVGSVPTRVWLPTAGVTAPVVAVGTDSAGALVIPERPTTIGWWSPGAMPGAPSGTAVLAGHVDSRVSGLGTFSVLRDLQPGDPVRVRGEDGRTFFFRVVARREVTKGALPDEVFSRHGPARLALVTCGGRFVPRLHGYEDNVIVFAEPDRARPPR